MKTRDVLRIFVDDESLTDSKTLENEVFDILINYGEKIENDTIEVVLDTYRYDKLKRSIINEVLNSKLSDSDKKVF